ncbi:hypothetical protein EXW95_18990 [Deinococcus sp. JMULE3]|nr:hypothetical protein [Deinococcus sp. JMULE3]
MPVQVAGPGAAPGGPDQRPVWPRPALPVWCPVRGARRLPSPLAARRRDASRRATPPTGAPSVPPGP